MRRPDATSAKPGAEHDRAAAAARPGLLDHVRDAGGRDRDDHRVDGLGQIGDRRHARPPEHLGRGRGLTPQTSPAKPIASRLISACAA